MKITDWSIIFVLIAMPIMLLAGWHTEQLRQSRITEITYTTALRTAVQDAGMVLTGNHLQAYEYGYSSLKHSRADKEAALEALITSLGHNLGIADDPLAMIELMRYIPAVVVIDYDGYYVYELVEGTDENNNIAATHQWLPKKPYVYEDQAGQSIAFTLDQQVTVINHQNGESVQGLREELTGSNLPDLLKNEDLFEQVRRATIVHGIEAELARAIERHNVLMRRLGWKYLFTMPTIPQEAWSNTLDEPGILVFLQGIPAGIGQYNNYALGGGRKVKSRPYFAGEDPLTGLRYVSDGLCDLPFEPIEIYAQKRDAAAAGYYEQSCR